MTIHPDFTFRRPTLDDAQAIVDLSNAGDILYTGRPQTDLNDVYDQWNAPFFDVERDAWVAETADGRIAAYMECSYEPGEEEVLLFYYVHPDFADAGLDATLLTLGEQHVPELLTRAGSEPPRDIMTAFFTNEDASRRLVEAHGYSAVRFFYRMEIDFDEPPPPVPQVDGVVIRAYDPERDEVALYEAIEDAFEDHWRHTRATLEQWRSDKIDTDRYDPALWLVAEAGGEVVGGAVCTIVADTPYVRMLGVRRPWRQRGIARAILLTVFHNFYARGHRRVGLGVDASSPTGATRLYESAGMRISDQRVVYAKPIAQET